MILSEYTKAINCTDANDCKEGIKEINKYLEDSRKNGKKPNIYAFTRLEKLYNKLIKFESKK